MKKILIAIVCILFGVVASAQLQQQSLGGSATTLSTTQGGLMGKLYFVLPKKDTLNNAATMYPGALTVRPQDTLITLYPPIYMSNGHFWISVGSGANGIDSITVSPDSTLYRAYNKGNQIFTFSTLLRNVKAGTNVTFTWDVDTLVINSSGGSAATDSTQWAVSDSLSTPAVTPREGTKFLVGLFATGAFSGHENQIATYDSVPAIYSFQSADIGDLLYNANNGVVSVWTGTAWVWVGRLIIHHPNDNYGFGLSLGTLGAFPVAIRTTNTPRLTIGANGDVTLNDYTSGHTGTPTGSLQVDATGKVIIGASGGSITASNGLTLSSSDVKLGGTLSGNTDITSGIYTLGVVGTNSNYAAPSMHVSNSNGGVALTVLSYAGSGSAAENIISQYTSTNDIKTGLIVGRETNGALPVVGMGASIDLAIADSVSGTGGGANTAARFATKWVDINHVTRTSEVEFYGTLNASQRNYMNIQNNGVVRVNNLVDTLATKAYARSVGSGGGGGGSSLANFYLKDSSLSSNRTVLLNGKTLQFNDASSNQYLLLDPVSFASSLSATDNTNLALLTLTGDASANFLLGSSDGLNAVTILGNAGPQDIAFSSLTATFSGEILSGPSTTTNASLNIPVGTAPTSPVDGDVWREDNTNTGLKIRVNGVTKTISLL